MGIQNYAHSCSHVDLMIEGHCFVCKGTRSKRFSKIYTRAVAFHYLMLTKAKEKYRGTFETRKSGDKTSSGETGLDIRTHASPKVGQDQESGGVSVLC